MKLLPYCDPSGIVIELNDDEDPKEYPLLHKTIQKISLMNCDLSIIIPHHFNVIDTIGNSDELFLNILQINSKCRVLRLTGSITNKAALALRDCVQCLVDELDWNLNDDDEVKSSYTQSTSEINEDEFADTYSIASSVFLNENEEDSYSISDNYQFKKKLSISSQKLQGITALTELNLRILDLDTLKIISDCLFELPDLCELELNLASEVCCYAYNSAEIPSLCCNNPKLRVIVRINEIGDLKAIGTANMILGLFGNKSNYDQRNILWLSKSALTFNGGLKLMKILKAQKVLLNEIHIFSSHMGKRPTSRQYLQLVCLVEPIILRW